MEIFFSPVPKWVKQVVSILELLMAIGGMGIGVIVLLLVLVMVVEDDPAALTVSLIGGTVILLLIGTGGATFRHAMASIAGKPSKLFRLPVLWKVFVLFGICVVLGWFIFQEDIAPGLFLSPILLVVCVLPPLAVLSVWGVGDAKSLTWRRCLTVFGGGATLAGVSILGVQVGWLIISEVFLDSVAVSNLITAIEDESAISLLVQSGFVIPIVSLLVAPLVTLPWLKLLSQRDAFLLGAIAGAGLAGVLTVIYISIDAQQWIWILFVQVIDCAVLPLSTGLVTLGWQRIVQKQMGAGSQWLALFGSASAVLILWNVGLVIILSSMSLEPAFPMQRLGVISIGLIAILLVALGAVCLWIGKWLTNSLSAFGKNADEADIFLTFTSNNQAISIWALVCVIILLPTGLLIAQFL